MNHASTERVVNNTSNTGKLTWITAGQTKYHHEKLSL